MAAGLAAAAPAPETVQGLYTADASEARLVTLKDGYTLLLRRPREDGAVQKVELAGKAEGDQVAFTGTDASEAEWTATWQDGRLRFGGAGEGLALERTKRLRNPGSEIGSS